MTEQPHPQRVRLLPWKRLPLIIDLALIAMTVVAVVGDRGADELDGRFEILAGAVTVGLILLRRRFPVPSLALAVGTMAILLATTGQPSVVMLGVLVTLHTVTSSVPLRQALVVGGGVATFFVLVAIAFLDGEPLLRILVSSVAWPALATATGMLVSASRTNLANVADRAERAEATRELEAQRRATQERLRIARDVHDVVGHHLAVINVQAGVAGHLLESDLDSARVALEIVRTSAATATTELGELLSVLRADGPGDATQDLLVHPTPDLDAVDELVESFASSGLDIERHRSGTRRHLGRSAEVAAYRVIQEALTNAHKHRDGTLALTQRFTDTGLEIIATNPVSSSRTGRSTDPKDGFGLVGMRERVAAVGGTLDIEPRPDRFTIRASIPTRTSDERTDR